MSFIGLEKLAPYLTPQTNMAIEFGNLFGNRRNRPDSAVVRPRVGIDNARDRDGNGIIRGYVDDNGVLQVNSAMLGTTMSARLDDFDNGRPIPYDILGTTQRDDGDVEQDAEDLANEIRARKTIVLKQGIINGALLEEELVTAARDIIGKLVTDALEIQFDGSQNVFKVRLGDSVMDVPLATVRANDGSGVMDKVAMNIKEEKKSVSIRVE